MKKSLTVLVLAFLLCLSLVALAPEAQAAPASWETVAEMPTERTSFVNAPLPDGRIFMALGYNSSAIDFALDAWIFDPEELSWTEVSDSPWGTELSSGAFAGESVYIFGGVFSNYSKVGSVLIYNVVADEWSIGPDAPFEGNNLRCALIDDHQILIVGGGSDYDECYILDTESMTFSATGSLPYGRHGGALVDMKGSLYYFGGFDSSNTAQTDVFYYYASGGYWWVETQMPEPRMGMSAVAATDGLIYLLGGDTDISWYSANTVSCMAYDVYEGEFVEVTDLPEPVRYSAACEISDGRILCYGGHDGSVGRTNVSSLRIWSVEASLSADSVEQGGSVWLSLTVRTYFAPMEDLYGTLFLTAMGVTFATFDIYAMGDMAYVEIPISEEATPLGYALVLTDLGYNYLQDFGDREFELTVTEAPSTVDRLSDLEEQNLDLKDQLDALQDDLDALEQQNDDLANDLSELKEANDAKMDAMIGYVILIVTIITLVVAVIVLVRKK